MTGVRTLGAIEAGGTKFLCAVGLDPWQVFDRVTIPTSDPATTMGTVLDFFGAAIDRHGPIDAIGIASFGPVELRQGLDRHGFITATPKAGWSGTDVAGPIRRAFGLPVGFDTDVNGAALGEGRWGAGRGLSSFVYITVGTGIGGGAVVNGRILHGMVHPEMGHLSIGRWDGDDFPGVCPYHGDCLEGMAAGPALEARFGARPEELDDARLKAAVEVVSRYLAAGLRNLVYALAPARVIVGGGVSLLPGLFPALRQCLEDALGGYPGLPEHRDATFVVPPELGAEAGIAGAFVLAETAASDE